MGRGNHAKPVRAGACLFASKDNE